MYIHLAKASSELGDDGAYNFFDIVGAGDKDDISYVLNVITFLDVDTVKKALESTLRVMI